MKFETLCNIPVEMLPDVTGPCHLPKEYAETLADEYGCLTYTTLPGREFVQISGRADDSRVLGAINFLIKKSKGVYVSTAALPEGTDLSSSLSLSITRKPEAADLKKASHFSVEPKGHIGELDDEEMSYDVMDPPLQVIGATIKKAIGNFYGTPFECLLACSDELKKKLELKEFTGLEFLPVNLKGKSKKAKQIYRMVSTVKLPPLKNRFVKVGSIMLDKYCQDKVMSTADFADPSQLAMAASNLDSLDSFDVASTVELFGTQGSASSPGYPKYPKLVVSKRFVEWAKKEKLPLDFLPIATDSVECPEGLREILIKLKVPSVD